MFRFACSVVLWGGRGAADKCYWCMWGALTVFWPHWVWPRSQHVCFPRLQCSGSRLLYRERAVSCMHFPGPSRSGPGSRVLHKGADLVGPAFCAFPGRAAQAARSLTSALSPGAVSLIPLWSQLQFPPMCTGPVHLVSLLGSWSLAATLPVDVKHPEFQEVFG